MVRSTGCSRRLPSVSLFTASRSLRSSDRAHGFAINSPSIPKETDVMNPLAKLTIDAHGGLENWKKFETASAHLVQGGVLWQLKGAAGWLDKTNVTVGLRSQWAYLLTPFLLAGLGVVCEELSRCNENGESWRRRGVHYPDSIATHGSRQTL